MSKLLKKVVALLLAVALVAPGFGALAEGPQFFPMPGPGEGTRETGSLTVTRTIGTATPVSGVPIRIQQVTLNPGAAPTQENLADPVWVNANTTPVPDVPAQYRVTGANGVAEFLNLPLGIWLVQELGSTPASSPVGAVTSPITDANERFVDFLVGIPTWIPTIVEGEEDGGTWLYDVRVYPKSQVPRPEGSYKRDVEIIGNEIVWELGTNIPATVGSLTHMSVVDIMSPGLQFVPGSVVGRFTRPTDDSYSWEDATGELIPVEHFTVVGPTELAGVETRVDIVLTAAGRAHLASQGLLDGEGSVMFRLRSVATTTGVHGNRANWYFENEPPTEPCDPEEEDCDEYDFCFLFPTHPDCEYIDFCDEFPELCEESDPLLSLNVLKRNVAETPLAGADFRVYRQLTAAEVALPAAERPAGTINNGVEYVVPLRNAAGAIIEGTTGTDGTLNFGGAPMSSEDHNIWLRETQAPTGYRVIDEWMNVNVIREYARPSTDIVDVIVVNEPADGWNLPQTGGVGTIVLTVAGLTLVGGALVLFVGSKKEEDVA